MEKITLKALQLAGFQNADMISKIISYVPNPQTAVEMLLGVYEQSQVDPMNKFRNYRYSRTNEFAEMVEKDDLGNTIKYRLYKQKTQRVWYLTKEDRDNKVYVTERPENSYDYGDIPAAGYDVTEHEKDLKQFEQDWCNSLSNIDALVLIQDWMDYGKPAPEPEFENELPF
jgi:hypothetical protein